MSLLAYLWWVHIIIEFCFCCCQLLMKLVCLAFDPSTKKSYFDAMQTPPGSHCLPFHIIILFDPIYYSGWSEHSLYSLQPLFPLVHFAIIARPLSNPHSQLLPCVEYNMWPMFLSLVPNNDCINWAFEQIIEMILESYQQPWKGGRVYHP